MLRFLISLLFGLIIGLGIGVYIAGCRPRSNSWTAP
jgi:hypothetical protein